MFSGMVKGMLRKVQSIGAPADIGFRVDVMETIMDVLRYIPFLSDGCYGKKEIKGVFMTSWPRITWCR
jgi:hypothetical protein